MQKFARTLINLMLIAMLLYAGGRLYFQLTGGFSTENITGMPDTGAFSVQSIDGEQQKQIAEILSQPFYYLGKGCQSYVFESKDHRYVIKFLKLQRFRPHWTLETVSFIPQMEKLREKKAIEKTDKLIDLLSSWKIAYEDIPEETGVIYMHLPHQSMPAQKLKIIDKAGITRELDSSSVAFLLQRKAEMLCPFIKRKMGEGNQLAAKKALSSLVSRLVDEYHRGFGDNDHALMQNTGVFDGSPVHIDVGQFTREERFKDPLVYREELFSKTYKFRIWLSKHYPELERHLYQELLSVIGPEIDQLKPKLKTVDEGA
jgi:hypothetical protein